MTLGKYTDTKTVVLRPEAIEIESDKCIKDEYSLYQFEGIIQDYIPQGGNIVRFVVLVEDTKLNVDTLIDNLNNFYIGQKVYLNIDLEKVLYYD